MTRRANKVATHCGSSGNTYTCWLYVLSLPGHECIGLPILLVRPRRTAQVHSVSALIVGLLAGAFGMAYIVYGRRQSKVVPVVCGVLLCVYPWLTDNVYALVGIGAALIALPFFVDF